MRSNFLLAVIAAALPSVTQAFFGGSFYTEKSSAGGVAPGPRWMTTRLASTAQPIVEEVAGRKAKYLMMEDAKGHTINTTMVAFLNHEGKRYALGVPIDSPMVLLDSRNRPIDPSDNITDRMFYQLDDYFTNKGYEILHTAGFLTIAGEPDWFDDDDDDDEEDSDDEESDDEDDEEERKQEWAPQKDDSVRVDPICDVEFEGSMYKIVQLLDRVPLSAEETPDGKWVLVTDTDTHLKLEGTATQR